MSERAASKAARWRVALACAALAAVWLAMLLAGRGSLDRQIYEALYAGGHPALILVARVFTFLGEPTLLIAASAVLGVWLWYSGRLRLGLALLLVTMTGRALSEIQKYEIARARPDLEPHLVIVKTSSFPSGHSTSSMVFYLTLALALTTGTRWTGAVATCAVLLSILIGTSRVMLGVHWPSDVVGGWSFGLLWVLLTLKPAERLLRVDSVKG